jgi:hypothetical protein
MNSLSGVRGEFIAVKIDPKLMETSKRYSLDYHMAVRDSVREITGKTGFSCPGLCGECDVKGIHACNSNSLKNIPILEKFMDSKQMILERLLPQHLWHMTLVIRHLDIRVKKQLVNIFQLEKAKNIKTN